jgi:hypothetical protein
MKLKTFFKLLQPKTPYEKSKDGTKGIVYKKTIEEVDAEIKEANKNIQDTDND